MELFGQQDRAIEGHPGHHLRMGELSWFSARFPYALIRLPPDCFKMFEQQNEDAEMNLGVTAHTVLGVEEAVQYLSVDIELHLRGSCIADAHGAGVLIAREPHCLPLLKLPLATQPVHDLDLLRTAGQRAQQPVLPCHSFVVVASIDKRQQGEGGIAQPAIAVIPVAHTADDSGRDVVTAATTPPVGR